jgi:hypothetical protein
VSDFEQFGVVICVAALALLFAVLSSQVSEWIRVPAPAIFLIAAAVASDLFHGLGSLPIKVDQRIVTVALALILFEGGMHIGWRRFRSTAGAVVWLGVVGTLVTAAALALAAHVLFGLGWLTSLLIGTALAPTDPAVVFSVLGRREMSGRSGTLLQGESGANDPVGIALMVSLLGAAGGGWTEVAGGIGQFALQMMVGGGRRPRRLRHAPAHPVATAERSALPDPHDRSRDAGLRRGHRVSRLGIPSRVPGRHPHRRRPRAVQARDRAIRRRREQPERDRHLHYPRPDHLAARRPARW